MSVSVPSLVWHRPTTWPIATLPGAADEGTAIWETQEDGQGFTISTGTGSKTIPVVVHDIGHSGIVIPRGHSSSPYHLHFEEMDQTVGTASQTHKENSTMDGIYPDFLSLGPQPSGPPSIPERRNTRIELW